MYIRKVRTASGATAVQVVGKSRGRIVALKHIGSAHSEAEEAMLVAREEEVMEAGQQAGAFQCGGSRGASLC